MKLDRRKFLKRGFLFLSTCTFPLRKAWAGVIPFAFWKPRAGVAQVTQLVVKAAAQGGSTNIRTTQVMAKVAAVGGSYGLQTTQVATKVLVATTSYQLRTTQVAVKVLVVP